MFFKKSWFYIIIYVGIFLTFLYLDYSIVSDPKLTWHIFLISMTMMIITSVVAIILSFKEKRSSEGALKVLNNVCFIFSICLTIFPSIWLGIILLIQYGS